MNDIAYEDLRFEMTTVTSEGRYQVIARIQDAECSDWLATPFEFATDDRALAERVRDLIVANCDDARERCRVAMGLTEEEFEADEIWIQLFLTDTSLPYSDIDDDYDVL